LRSPALSLGGVLTDDLLELQRLDTTANQLAHRRQHAPERTAATEAGAALAAHRRRHAAAVERSEELELGIDALERDESAGAHFREEHQTPDGEALRDDESHAAVFAWEFQGDGHPPKLHREQLHFETVHLAQRSYK